RVLGHGGTAIAGQRRVVDRVDGDRDGLGGAAQRRAAAEAGSAAVVGITAVGDLVGERIGAVVVGGRGVGAGGAAAAQAAVARAADDGVGQVGIAGLDVADQGAQ